MVRRFFCTRDHGPPSGRRRDRVAWREPHRQLQVEGVAPKLLAGMAIDAPGAGPSVVPMLPQQEKASRSATSRVAGEVPNYADRLTRIPYPAGDPASGRDNVEVGIVGVMPTSALRRTSTRFLGRAYASMLSTRPVATVRAAGRRS